MKVEEEKKAEEIMQAVQARAIEENLQIREEKLTTEENELQQQD